MKNTNRCSKCGAKDVVRIPGKRESLTGIKTGATVLSIVKVTRYFCGQCGFIERWVDEKEDIQKIKRKFENRKP